MSEKIHIQDESGDKKYFTIVPNYILNHSTLWDREVYIQMKRITGENGTCWTSQSRLAKQCGISINRLKKSLKYLLDHNWIKFRGKKIIQTKGGEQEVNEYSVSDLWKMNNTFYEDKGISPNDTPVAKGVSPDGQRGITDEAKGVSPDDDKEEPMNNIPLKKIGDKSPTPQEEAKDFFTNEELQKKAEDYATSKEIPKSEIKKFILYWTEPTKTGKKQRWETEKTFEVKRRLLKWFENYQKFNQKKSKWNVI